MDSNILFEVVSGETLTRSNKFRVGTPENGKLHYYNRISGIFNSPSDYEYIVAYIPNVTFEIPCEDIHGNRVFDYQTCNAVVGMIELQKAPSSPDIWLKYVTVDPLYKRQGICSKLYQMMASSLPELFNRWNSSKLVRSMPSDEGLLATHRMTSILDNANIPWKWSQA